jgi:GT2 family glycosyltransferase
VPRLSIVITATEGTQQLETTLVSVLENRPHDAEIIVPLGHDYADPYRLEGEVRFLRGAGANDWLHLANAALPAASGAVVHLLSAGTQVSEGWTCGPLALFANDETVASIAPLVLCAQNRRDIAAAGIEYGRSGRRRVRRETLALSRICDSAPRPEIILGPTHAAAFYRRDALEAIGGEFPSVAGEVADVDVALSLAELGYLSLLEPISVVYAPHVSTPPRPWADGRASEAVFWRHAAAMGWCSSLAAHCATWCGEALASIVRPKLARKLFGRTVSLCGALRHMRHAAHLQQQTRLADVAPASLSLKSHRSNLAAGSQPPGKQARRAA